MDGVQIVSVIVAASAGIGAVLSYFKFKPGQRESLETAVEQNRVNVAQATLNVAQGTINLVTTELEDQFKRMSAQVRELEARLPEQQEATRRLRDDMQARIDALGVELGAEKAEKAEVERRNVILQARVQHLEDEVAALKNGRAAGD